MSAEDSKRNKKNNTDDPVMSDLWTVDDVAAYFKVTHWTIRQWRNLDATFPMPLDLPGRSLRWYREDILEWALSLRGQLV